MARTKKTKISEKKVSPANTETESSQTENDSSNTIDVGKSDDDAIAEIMSGFDEPNLETPIETPIETEAEVTPTEDFSPPRRRERKPRTPKTEKEKMPFKVPGKLVVKVTNRVMVGAITIIDGYVSKNPIAPEFISLTDEELNDPEFEEMATEAVKAMKLSENPILVFFGSMAATILTNYSVAKSIVAQQLKVEKMKAENMRKQTEKENAAG